MSETPTKPEQPDYAERLRFTDDAGKVAKSGLWLPALAAIVLFLVAAAAIMVIASLSSDATGPKVPAVGVGPHTTIQQTTPSP